MVREPVLQDKRAEHVKFQQNCWNLIKSVSSPGDNDKILGESDYSLEMLHRASVVAQTKITFPKKQLLQLIQVCMLQFIEIFYIHLQFIYRNTCPVQDYMKLPQFYLKKQVWL